MKLIKKDGELGTKNITLSYGKKSLSFIFGGTLDLYWTLEDYSDLSDEEIRHDYFIITKENYTVYSLFEELYNNIKNINISDDNEFTNNNNKLTFNAMGKNVMYQGKSVKKLPITTIVTYKLDGKSIELNDLLGKSGNVTINIKYINITVFIF